MTTNKRTTTGTNKKKPEDTATNSPEVKLPSPVTHDVGGLLTFIERAARDPSFDVAKFSILLDRQEALLKAHQLASFNAAFSDMQEEFTAIKKSGKNPTFSNPYAKLEDLDRAARPVWTKYGFSVRFGTKTDERQGWMTKTMTLAHRGGHVEVTELSGPIDYQAGGPRARTPIQAVGSTNTYLMRYLLMSGLNLVPRNDPSDDDGEAVRPKWTRPPPRSRTNMPEGSEQLDAPDDDRIPEDQWDAQTGELPPLSGEEAEFKKLALEAASRGHEQLATLYKNSNARNRQRIEDWKDELEARYPEPERPPDAEGGTTG